jgi:prepilin-type N-terminal cleavage/methylation domain-containing protein
VRLLVRLRSRLSRTASEQDRGDTLIEILVTVAIVSIAVVALLGGVLASTTASTTHRNLTTVDGVLKSFAETARNTIETQASNGSAPPQSTPFTPCASSSQYEVVSAPFPNRGPVGSVVTVFATGFSGSTGATFTSTTNPADTHTVTVTYSGNSSGAMAMFTVPAGLSGTYSIIPFDSTHAAASDFTVDPSAPESNALTFQGYQLNSWNEYWTGSGWTKSQSSCSPNLNSNLQQLTYQLVTTQNDNGASDQTSIVVADFTPLPVPALSVSCNEGPSAAGPTCGSSYSLGKELTFTASLSGLSGLTGTITWTLPPGETCIQGNGPQPISAPTCTVGSALAGTLAPAAIYSGDATHSGVAAVLSPPITISRGNISVVVTGSGTPVPPPSANISFTINVSGVIAGIAPASGLQLTLTTKNNPNGYSSTNCSGQITITGNSPPPLTCNVQGATSGSYTLTATYPGGDPNYAGSTSSTTIIVQFPGVPTVSYTPLIPTVGNPLVFSATIAQPTGAPVPTGTITWTGTNLPASCTPKQLPASAPYTVTCSIPNASRTLVYSAKAAYSGDPYYASGSDSVTAPIALYAATPVLTCNGCSLRHAGGSFTVTATITPPNGAPVPTGSVTWTVSGNATSCTGGSTTSLPPAPGPYTATCTISNDSRGNYNFTATYNANQSDPNYAPETSSVLTETVR